VQLRRSRENPPASMPLVRWRSGSPQPEGAVGGAMPGRERILRCHRRGLGTLAVVQCSRHS
jgi:hypothetical protein